MDPATAELQQMAAFESNERAKLKREVADLKEAVQFLLAIAGDDKPLEKPAVLAKYEQLLEKLGVDI